jgi:hypothetical protein
VPDFIVDMASRCGTSGTDIPDDLSPLDLLAYMYCILPVVRIIRRKMVTMGDHNNIASAHVITGKDDNPVRRRRERGARVSGNINAPVKFRML